MTAPETVTIDGVEYEVRGGDYCGSCALSTKAKSEPCPACTPLERSDGRNVIFIRKEEG